MKALLLTEYKKLEVTDIPVPEIGPDDVLVQVRACGICGSDIHGYDGSTGRRIPPLVMGHEAAGVVSAVGENVSDVAVGDRVTFDSMVCCRDCHFCAHGQVNLCDNRRVLGVSCEDYRRYGAFAEYVSVPKHIVFKIPENLPFEHAAMIEAVSVAVHAVNLTPIRLGDSALVVGSGMIGLLVIQALKRAGCTKIIATDLSDQRLEVAKQLGATHTINAKDEQLVPKVIELCNGRGADVALEVVGSTVTVNTAIKATRKGGTVTIVGNLSPTIEFPLQSVVTREINVIGSCASCNDYPACIELLESGQIQVEPLITAKASLEEGQDWFDKLYSGDGSSMKVLICPTSD